MSKSIDGEQTNPSKLRSIVFLIAIILGRNWMIGSVPHTKSRPITPLDVIGTAVFVCDALHRRVNCDLTVG